MISELLFALGFTLSVFGIAAIVMGKNENRRHNRLRTRLGLFTWVFVSFLCQSFSFCSSLNDEGFALLRLKERVVNDPFGALTNWTDDREADPCSWSGVECSDGNVIVLGWPWNQVPGYQNYRHGNLKDLCLEGTLPSDLGNLVHIKTIILRNNSFNGRLPEGFGKLKNLEFLDLGFNNFTGSVPNDLCSNLSLTTLLLDNNGFLGSLPPEIYELQLLSEYRVDKNQLSKPVQCLSGSEKSRSVARTARHRRLSGTEMAPPPPQTNSSGPSSSAPPKSSSMKASPSEMAPPPPQTNSSGPSSSAPPKSSSMKARPSQAQSSLAPPSNASSASEPGGNSLAPPPPDLNSAPVPSSHTETPKPPPKSSSSKRLNPGILAAILVGIIFLLLSAFGLYFWKTNRLTSGGLWATGLNGQLQKAFVVGVPKLKRSELEAACEDFSNVIGSSLIGTLYKGTLSSGVEIAVASVAVKSNNDWSWSLEEQFRKKIETLSKANHKNFISLLGYCEEDEPFTRMVVYEYAPNGTLFEHLHIQEAEHLDWGARLRIVMGIAYCLDHLHQLNPPLIHSNLTSLSVNLTEDYAAKISEFSFSNEMASSGWSSIGIRRLNASTGGLKSNVHNFGMILFEIMTGRMLKSVDTELREDEKAYLRGRQPLREMVDPALNYFQMDQLEQIGEVMRRCLNSEPKQRPSMAEVSAKLRSITGISPDEAVPKASPLWWAELEIMSVEG